MAELRSSTASSSGRPTGNAGAANAASAALVATSGESNTNSRASMAAGSGAAINQAGNLSHASDVVGAGNATAGSSRTLLLAVTLRVSCGSCRTKYSTGLPK